MTKKQTKPREPKDMNPMTLMLLTVLANAIVTGIIVYLIQKRIERSYTRQLEEFKASLQYSNFQQQTKFSRNYPRTLEILETLHQKVMNYSHFYSELTYDIEAKISGRTVLLTDEEFQTKASGALGAFFACPAYLHSNRIYLPDTLVGELENIIDKLHALDFYLTSCIDCLQKPEEYFPPFLARTITDRHSLSYLRFADEMSFQKINPADKKAPVIFVRAIHGEVKKQLERLEKLYKSVADIADKERNQ